jgi:hypothetical protein
MPVCGVGMQMVKRTGVYVIYDLVVKTVRCKLKSGATVFLKIFTVSDFLKMC